MDKRVYQCPNICLLYNVKSVVKKFSMKYYTNAELIHVSSNIHSKSVHINKNRYAQIRILDSYKMNHVIDKKYHGQFAQTPHYTNYAFIKEKIPSRNNKLLID